MALQKNSTKVDFFIKLIKNEAVLNKWRSPQGPYTQQPWPILPRKEMRHKNLDV